MPQALIAILALVAGFAPSAAQDDGGGAAAMADRLHGMGERLESINASNTWILLASLVMAAVAAWAAVYYGKQLKGQLALAKDGAGNRLRPALAWCLLGDLGITRAPAAGALPAGLMIRVINTGQASARDIVACQDCRQRRA